MHWDPVGGGGAKALPSFSPGPSSVPQGEGLWAHRCGPGGVVPTWEAESRPRVPGTQSVAWKLTYLEGGAQRGAILFGSKGSTV